MLKLPCSVCGKVFPVTSEFFPMDLRRNCRGSSKCRDCHNAHLRKKYAEHPESSAKYRLEHRDELLVKKHEYWEKNKDSHRARSKAYYESHKEEHYARSVQWKKDNPDKVKAYTRVRYERNREHMLMVSQNWKNNNRDAVNTQWQRREAKKKSLKSTLTKEQWKLIKQEFDFKCAYCGKEKPLTQDHFVPVSKNGEYTLNNIIPACSTCNCNKFNNDFFEWYPTFKHYSKKREKHILKFLGYDNNIQQLEFEEVKLLSISDLK